MTEHLPEQGSSMDQIFLRLQNLAARREAEVSEDLALNRPVGASAHKKSDAEHCPCDGESFMYLKVEGRHKQYVVCPVCNPRLSCLNCGGTGHHRHFNLSTLRDDVTPYGCECTRLEKRVALLNSAGIPEKYYEVSFGALETEHLTESQSSKLNTIVQSVQQFCDHARSVLFEGNISHDKYFLTLVGPVGTGKTHLGVAALKELILEHGATGKFIDFLFLLSQLRDTYSKKGSEENVLQPLRDADVLLIDELGKGRTENEWQLEKLDDLLNSRYNSGRITILTSNYLPPELKYDPVKEGLRSTPANETFWTQSLPERIGARMYDRILEASFLIDFMGLESYRRLQAQEFLSRYMTARERGASRR